MSNKSAQQKQTNTDIPVEIIGYITDPKQVGYQILTNYESTYWRALVGYAAWSLYEVLRSFCHRDNSTCRPSVNTLVNILGLTDRRQLTGRVYKRRGKESFVPGFIDKLQNHQLVVAEEQGKDANLRYIFHVNLTPPALTSEQVKQLPKSLQKRHDRLLKRAAEATQKLDQVSRKKRPKGDVRGSGAAPDPSGATPYPSGAAPDKQHPYNNTHITTVAKGEEDNNSRGKQSEVEDSKTDVVVVLTDRGISKRSAQRLAEHYSNKRVLERVDWFDFRMEKEPAKITDPPGYLRRSIEDPDWRPPTGYKSRQQREAEEEEKKRRREEVAQAAAEREEEARRVREEEVHKRGERLAKLKAEYGTNGELENAWSNALERASPSLGISSHLFNDSELLAVEGDEKLVLATIAVRSGFVRQALGEAGQQAIARALAESLEKDRVRLKFVVV